jgi:hypothetical protein
MTPRSLDQPGLNPPKKGPDWNHGVLISDELLDASLKCKTKAQLTFGPAGKDEPSHPISYWQPLAENYEAVQLVLLD